MGAPHSRTGAYEDYDSYDVVRMLANKAGSVTELVASEADGRLYVRKTVARELANPEAWAAVARLSHPLIPVVCEQGWRGDTYRVVYEFVPGESIATLVERAGSLSEERVVAIMRDVAFAASALHAAGIVHRDISPGNVIVDAAGRAHLTDLGIARLTNETGSCDTTRLGTWGFAAPEQYGFAQTDARSDVYSMGRLLAFACTGITPEVASAPLEAAGGGLEGISPELAAVVVKACAFEPSARYQSATEFAVALPRYGNAPRNVQLATPTRHSAEKPVSEQPIPEHATVGSCLAHAAGALFLVSLIITTIVFLFGGIGVLTSANGAEYPFASFLVGLVCAALTGTWSYQTACALLHRGVYAEREGRIKRLLKAYGRALLWFIAASFTILFAVAIISKLVSGN